MMRSPDLRLRSTLDSVPSLPQLKEGSPETSADDLQTPKQSPEREFLRDSEQNEDEVASDKEEEEEEEEEEVEEGEEEMEEEVAANLDGSLQSLSSVKIALSHEGSPERKMMPQEQVSPKDDDRGELDSASLSHQDQELELSYDRASKMSEDTLSAPSTEFLAVHSKSPSDAGGANNLSSRDLSRAFSSSSPLSIAHMATHSKAASDDVTVLSSTRSLIIATSKAGSRSLTGINSIGVRPGEAFEALKQSSLHEHKAAESEGNAEMLPQERDKDLDHGSVTKELDLGETAMEQDSDLKDLDETVISPTLRIKKEEQEVDKEEENSGAKVQSMGEDALFEMLEEKGEKAVEIEPEGQESSGGSDAVSSQASGDMVASSTHREGQTEDKEMKAVDILDEFDKMLDMEETVSVSSAAADEEDLEVPSSPADSEPKQVTVSLDTDDTKPQPSSSHPPVDSEKSSPFHQEDNRTGKGSVEGFSIAQGRTDEKEENSVLDFKENEDAAKQEGLTKVEEDRGKDEGLRDGAGSQFQDATLLPLTDRKESKEDPTSKGTLERTLSSDAEDVPGKGSPDATPSSDRISSKCQDGAASSVDEHPGTSLETGVRQECLEEKSAESLSESREREVSEEVDEDSRQTSEEPQDQER